MDFSLRSSEERPESGSAGAMLRGSAAPLLDSGCWFYPSPAWTLRGSAVNIDFQNHMELIGDQIWVHSPYVDKWALNVLPHTLIKIKSN